MKRSLLGGLLLAGALTLTACGGDVSGTPTPSTSKTSPAPAESPSPTPTVVDTPTLATQAVIVATPKMMAVVDAWGTSITVWTSATDPLADLAGLTAENVGFWNNSSLGMGTYTAGKDLFAAFGEPRDDGIYGCPFVDDAFTGGCGDIRIYFADSTVTSVAGGIPVVFEAG